MKYQRALESKNPELRSRSRLLFLWVKPFGRLKIPSSGKSPLHVKLRNPLTKKWQLNLRLLLIRSLLLVYLIMFSRWHFSRRITVSPKSYLYPCKQISSTLQLRFKLRSRLRTRISLKNTPTLRKSSKNSRRSTKPRIKPWSVSKVLYRPSKRVLTSFSETHRNLTERRSERRGAQKKIEKALTGRVRTLELNGKPRRRLLPGQPSRRLKN